MPELGQFRSAAHFYSVFAHEITHSTGNINRLKRDMSGRFSVSSFARFITFSQFVIAASRA